MSPRRRRRSPLLLAAGAVIALLSGAGLAAMRTHSCADLPQEVTVTRAVDGDTIKVTFCGQTEDVRIIGLDTPESVKPGVKPQCWSAQATTFAKRLENRVVFLSADGGAGERDKYGRLLAFVQTPGRDFSLEAIKAGHGRAEDYGHKHARVLAYERAEAVARRAKLGVWRCPAPFKR